MASLQLQAYEILKQKFGEKDAFVVIDFIEANIEKQVDTNTKHLAIKEDLSEIRSELAKTIYIVGLVQFLAIVGSVIAIMSFMLKH
jgi:hypothetical protein